MKINEQNCRNESLKSQELQIKLSRETKYLKKKIIYTHKNIIYIIDEAEKIQQKTSFDLVNNFGG